MKSCDNRVLTSASLASGLACILINDQGLLPYQCETTFTESFQCDNVALETAVVYTVVEISKLNFLH